MTISKEIRQAIYNLHDQGKSIKEIYSVLKMQNISISEKYVSRIVKEDRQNNNNSFLSCIPEDETEAFSAKTDLNEFNDSFNNETKKETKEETRQEETKDIQETVQTIHVIQDVVKDEVQKVMSTFNQEITERNDKLDVIIKEVKKNRNKPLNMSKTLKSRVVFNTEGLTESEKRIRRNLIIKIRNYVDCFSDNDITFEVCGNDFF